VEEVLRFATWNTELCAIAITDHNTMEGAFRAKELCPKFGLEVILGEEIDTQEGHLIGLFLERPINPGKPAEETVEIIHKQGGLAVIPHPMGRGSYCIKRGALRRLLHVVDGIELLNPTWGGRLSHRSNRVLSERAKAISATGGSDAHLTGHIGRAHTLFPGSTAAELRQALEERATRPGGGFWTVSDHLSYFGELGLKWASSFGHIPLRRRRRARI
jgi:predicted metal-dependent phosphoesterase TrpH